MITNIIISKQDRASQNIKNMLLQIREWHPLDTKCTDVLAAFEFKQFRIVEIDGLHIYQDGLDEVLKDCNLQSDLIIFASKHRSKDGRKILTVHATGNTREAKFGGKPMELAAAAPQAMRSIFLDLMNLSKNEDFVVSLESTHHGPSSISIPSLFVEIGSSEKEWIDPVAGRIVANAILMMGNENVPVAVGFGGNHYAPRQTRLVEHNEVTFGHIFPTYKLNELNENIIEQAFHRSGADFAYFDRKSMSAEQRNRLAEIIGGLGYEVLRESDINEIDGVPWQFCLQLRDKVNDLCPTARTRITDNIKCELKTVCSECICPKVKVATISPELLSEAEKLNRQRLKKFLETHSIAYLEHADGRFSHIIMGIDDECARLVAEGLTNECINILKEHFDIRYDKNEEVLFLINKKFNPLLAKKLGVTSGPMFGALASGKSVNIGERTIKPEMVYEISEKPIPIKNLQKFKQKRG